MRILHVTDVYVPRIGGIELQVRDLAARQRAQGHDVHVATTTPAAGDLADEPGVHRIDGVSVTGRGVPDPTGFDVIHVHLSVVSPFATLTARRSAALRVPTVVTVHSLWSKAGPVPGLTTVFLGLRRWPVVWSAVSRTAAERLQTVLGAGTTVHTMANAVDPDAWRLPELPAPDGPPTVISVMRLARTKRPLALARMLRRASAEVPLRAVIVGDGPQGARLGHYLHRKGMTRWIELPGRLDRAGIREQLARSSVYIAPAELESFGVAALEARCAGLPVVASSRSGVGEFVTHGVEGFLGDDDAAMTTALVRLLTDDDLRRRISRHNRSVPSSCDWTTACATAERLYVSAASIAAAARQRSLVGRP